MIDLAGIRIKLYFPDDLDKIRDIIWEIFDPLYPPRDKFVRKFKE
jgi:ppGpp synthetase/RelA/SpoT-type nucleotidyltranferase